MRLSYDDGYGIENVTIQMNLRFSKLSGCDLNVQLWVNFPEKEFLKT